MSEMIEQAARAVFKAHAEKTAAFKRDNPGTLVADVSLTHEEMVIATLLAIREPTEEMIAAGESAASVGIGKPTDDEALPRVWAAMIDAALK